jgi:hypothetical protein
MAENPFGKIEVEVFEYPAPAGAAELRDVLAEVLGSTEGRRRMVTGAPQVHFTCRVPTAVEVAFRRDRGARGRDLYSPMDVLLVTVFSLPGPGYVPEAVDAAAGNGHT